MTTATNVAAAEPIHLPARLKAKLGPAIDSFRDPDMESRRFSVDLHPGVREAIDARADAHRTKRPTEIEGAVEWYIRRLQSDALPPRRVDSLRTVSSNVGPRSTSIGLPAVVDDLLTELAASADYPHGSTKSEVIRTILDYFLSACIIAAPSSMVNATP